MDTFKYISYAVMVAYIIYSLYLFTPFYNKSGWSSYGDFMLLAFASVPIFMLSSFWLMHSIKRHDPLGYCLAGLVCAIPIGFILFSIVHDKIDSASKIRARQYADSALSQELSSHPDGRKYSLYESNFGKTNEGVSYVYFVYTEDPYDTSKAHQSSIYISINVKTGEVIDLSRENQ